MNFGNENGMTNSIPSNNNLPKVAEAPHPIERKLYTHVSGKGHAVVLVHGWGMNHGIWDSVAETLSRHYQVIVIDLPGFGNSADVALAEYSLANVALSVLHNIPENAIIIGWSLGGLIAQYIAMYHPEKIKGLVTVASSPRFVADNHWPGIQPKVLKNFQQQLEKDFTATIKRFLAIQTMGSPSPKQEMKLMQNKVETITQSSPQALRDGLALLLDTDLRPMMGSIKCPVLRLYGRLDSLVPIKAISEISALDNSSDYVFQKASHAPFISDNAQFCKHLHQWITENITETPQMIEL